MTENFATVYEAYAAKRANSPATFHRFAALAIACAALEGRVWLEANWGRVYPALWVAFIGPSAVKKSSAVNQACNLLIKAKENIVLPQTFSAEAFIELLARREQGCYGLLQWAELGVALESLSKDYNTGLMSLFTDLFDSAPSKTRETKGAGKVELTYPAVSIVAGGKVRWLKDFLKPRQVSSGFLGRWLFVHEQDNPEYRSMFRANGRFTSADFEQEKSLIEHLQRLMAYEGVVGIDDDAAAHVDAWAKDLQGKWDEERGDPAEFSKRAEVQVTKLAIGIQACRGVSYLVSLDLYAVKTAIEYWMRTFDDGRWLVGEIVGHSSDSDELETVLQSIKDAGTIKEGVLLRKLRMKAHRLSECTSTLVTSDQITQETEQREGPGRRAVVFRYVG